MKSRLFDMTFDLHGLREAARRIAGSIRRGDALEHCRYVSTVNVDVLVQIHRNPAMRRACEGADMMLIDGKPIIWVARALGADIPEAVPGSDLVPALFDLSSGHTRVRVFLLGARPEVGSRAAQAVRERWPEVEVAGQYSPPLGFEHDADECARIVRQVNESGANLLVLGFGAPKQELWIERHCRALAPMVAICAGATIDFLAGEQQRAPEWMRRRGLEWLYRLCSDPRRLWRRYGRDFLIFPQIIAREVCSRAAKRRTSARRDDQPS
ncbi:MAG: WecB/TagA/CpsF family glycosyltransferase [Betaproteobacteria bacterium]|nr:WecB/TagA/CpsF family glycosyltransferase [Betaproteobacteria bacterium]